MIDIKLLNDFEGKVRRLAEENMAMREKIVELKCIVAEREKILDRIHYYVDEEDPDDGGFDAAYFMEVIGNMIECRTDLSFSLINKEVVHEKDGESAIQKRLGNIGA